MRSIPAWAGETAVLLTSTPAIGVYPRVGGGNWSMRVYWQTEQGLSPRGRGKLFLVFYNVSLYWSIPAWAGETGRYSPVLV